MKQSSKRKMLMGIYCMLLLTTVIFFPIGKTGADTSTPEIDLSLSPGNYLFTIDQLKPGDWANRTLTIQNKGNQNFTYKMNAKHESGSKKLYENLRLIVKNSKETLYSGTLSDFKGVAPRYLSHFTEEDLKFTIEFPAQLGNEFQGLETEVAFQFTTIGTGVGADDPIIPNDSPGQSTGKLTGSLPNTGEAYPLLITVIGFLIMTTGVILIVRHTKMKYQLKRG
ncbi:LPXTG-motif cell wall-anchored protein [Bacillus pakistanensis]|uniref:LPXTG-motif cell wall-anchored protein n=1 Tax=Rossellomorea pakistanensis TaxID=992288 RepID=A0ABS2NBS8_9BACI|nr:LPXTG cell wall anchor domain-containing protein [Bacillus pakistanensis]MBM7585293.1 LPXTG-motif cell wall-anchored protein [Bacillus pakistanensis]